MMVSDCTWPREVVLVMGNRLAGKVTDDSRYDQRPSAVDAVGFAQMQRGPATGTFPMDVRRRELDHQVAGVATGQRIDGQPSS